MARNQVPSLVSGGNIYPCRFVKQSAAADYRGLQCGANEVSLGISHEGTNYPPLSDLVVSAYHAAAGDPIGLYGEGEECLLLAGDTIVRGNRIKSDADGKGVPVLTVGTVVQNVGAIAQESCASGSMFRVQIRHESVRPALA